MNATHGNPARPSTVGVIGAGVIAQQVHLPVLLNLPGVTVKWIADIDLRRAQTAAQAYGLAALPLTQESLPAADVVLIAVPPGVRDRYYEGYAASETAVLAEKPFAVSLQEHDRFCGMFPPHRLGCGYQRRFYSSTRVLKKLIDGQWFGRLRKITIAEGDRTARTGSDSSYIDNRKLSGGGVLASVGCHALDLAFFVTGANAFSVETRDLVMDGDIDRKSSAVLRLRNSNTSAECELDYTVSWLDRQPNTLTLEFEQMIVETGVAPGSPVRAWLKGKTRDPLELTDSAPGASTSYQAFASEWIDFFRGLNGGYPSTISAASSRITEACFDALYSGNSPDE